MTKKSSAVLRLLCALIVMALIAVAAVMGIGSEHYGSAQGIKLGLDLAGGVSITYESVKENPTDTELSDTKSKLEQRAFLYSNEAEVYLEGTNRINVDIPDVTDANTILAELGQPGSLTFVDSTGAVVMDGTYVADAQPYSYKNQTTNANEYVVSLVLSDEGSKKFAEITEANIGNYIDIVYDGEIASHARVNEKIDSTTCQISGMESWEAASKLASTIRIGAVPLELTEVRSNVVGAKLGEEAINTSLLAAAIGIGLVLLIMLVFYRIAGLAADLALAIYTGLVIFIISAFEITLTLPGIAGIILSIGMAVDANVVIFSRIREELGRGMSVKAAVKQGFSKALSAIVDGNVTTLIAAAVLYILGSGTVRGFASTLAVGILLSMFTALVVTRFFLNIMIDLGATSPSLFGITTEKAPVDFVGKRKFSFVLPVLIVLTGIGFMVYHGNQEGDYILNYNIDFIGGTSATITMPEAMSLDTANKELVPLYAEAIGDTAANVRVNTVNDTNEIVVKSKTLTLEERTSVEKALEEKYGIGTRDIVMENISATIGSEMRRDAIIAVIVATLFMLAYIWFRFKDLFLATSSVLALLHDVLVVLTCYAILRWSVGTTFIACMLTIVGYSINATIVIFDRLRENLKYKKKGETIREVVNRSITQSIGRSINTSLTTLVMVIMLAVLGVTSIREFAFPLITGILYGDFSSLFIAAPLWYTFKGDRMDKAKECTNIVS